MKVYDYQWAATFGMDARRAAVALVEDGVDTVLVRNQIDPLPNSGVDQEAYLRAGGTAFDIDGVWSDALREAGLRVLQTTALLFEPNALIEFPDARPINANGDRDPGFDWYRGICPTHRGYLAEKTARLTRVTRDLAPDGLFLSFTRYPGFWENWLPDYTVTNADRFCFCDRCRQSFALDRGIELPSGDIREQARFILDEQGPAWTAWRCARIHTIIADIAAALRQERPALEIMLNTLAFPASDFGGIAVRREIAAQDLALLSDTVQCFELMTYLQILNRQDSWLAAVVAEARAAAPTCSLVCTLQVAPLYTDGVHAGRGRAFAVTADDLDRSARAALAAGADGLVFYHWTDFLEDEAVRGRKRDVLRRLAHA